jgi:hypothetical protein
MTTLLLLTASILGSTGTHHPIVIDRVDLIEVNHCYDDSGRPLSQVIYYDWHERLGRYMVRDWRHLKDDNQRPVYCSRRRLWVAVWYDAKTKLLRQVQAPLFRQTWTLYDPEMANRKIIPDKYRSQLLITEVIKTVITRISFPP